MAEISLRAKTLNNYIFLLQEPWINNTGAISGLEGGANATPAQKRRPGVHLCSQGYKPLDIPGTVGQGYYNLYWADPISKKNTYIISGYLDITTRTIPPS